MLHSNSRKRQGQRKQTWLVVAAVVVMLVLSMTITPGQTQVRFCWECFSGITLCVELDIVTSRKA